MEPEVGQEDSCSKECFSESKQAVSRDVGPLNVPVAVEVVVDKRKRIWVAMFWRTHFETFLLRNLNARTSFQRRPMENPTANGSFCFLQFCLGFERQEKEL